MATTQDTPSSLPNYNYMTLDRPSRRKAIPVINTIYLSLYSSIHYIQQVNNKCKIEKKQKSFFKPIVKRQSNQQNQI